MRIHLIVILSLILAIKKANEIKPVDIHEWHLYETNRGVTANNLRERHVVLSSFLNYLVRFYGLKSNPCNLCGPPPAGTKRKNNFLDL